MLKNKETGQGGPPCPTHTCSSTRTTPSSTLTRRSGTPISSCAAPYGLAFSEEGYQLYHKCNADLWRDFDRGLCTKEYLLVERFRRYLAITGERADPEALNRDHLRALGEGAMLLPGAEELCRVLSRDHRLYLLTNAVASVQKTRFANSAIAPYFQGVFISEEVGVGKPDSRLL